MKKTVLVTGASGFVGTNFIEKFSSVYNILTVNLRTTDIDDIDFTGINAVLHLAAVVHQMNGASEEEFYRVNRDLTEKLAVKAKNNKVGHFIFYSTVGVWGTHGYFDHDKVITLETNTNPKTPYAKSKLEAEIILRALESSNYKISILRPPMIYGENCPGNLPRLEKLVKMFPILPFNYSKNKRSMINIKKLVNDTGDIIDNKKKGIFIPKDDEDYSIKEIINKLAIKNNKSVILMPLPDFLITFLYKIKPNIIASLFGSLRFKQN